MPHIPGCPSFLRALEELAHRAHPPEVAVATWQAAALIASVPVNTRKAALEQFEQLRKVMKEGVPVPRPSPKGRRA